MISHREYYMTTDAIYTGGEELAAREHPGNEIGDPERGPRVVVDAPGLAVVLTADEAEELGRQLRVLAEQARFTYKTAS